jgi:diphosphomevalonate decarboxylase
VKIIKVGELMKCGLLIESNNNFNTAAGLASSSSGLSCLGVALAHLYGLEGVDFSVLARIGSGSAVRSVYGGFVKWEKGWSEISQI